jgi:hypothetical protein
MGQIKGQGYSFGEGGFMELAKIEKNASGQNVITPMMYLMGNRRSLVGITGANYNADQKPHTLAVNHIRGDSAYYKFLDSYNPAYINKPDADTNNNNSDETFVDFTHSEGGNTDNEVIHNDKLFIVRYYGSRIRSDLDIEDNAKNDLKKWSERYIVFGICQIANASSSYSSQGNQKISQTLTLNFVQPIKTNLNIEDGLVQMDIEGWNIAGITSLTTNATDRARFSEFVTEDTPSSDDMLLGEYQYSRRVVIAAAGGPDVDPTLISP